MHLEDGKKVSHASMRSRQDPSGTPLNECLHPQRNYLSMEITDPDGARLAEVSMSYDQFVRLLLCNSDVPVTLSGYRAKDGSWASEKVEPPPSVRDRVLDRMDDALGSLKARIADLRKDLYEALNDGKAGKQKLSQLLADARTIEDHFASNIPYVTERAAEEVSDIEENAKAQLAIFASTALGAKGMAPGDFSPLIAGPTLKALPAAAEPVREQYEAKERKQKAVDDMTAREVADTLSKVLTKLERGEKEADLSTEPRVLPRALYCASAHESKGRVYVTYVGYQGTTKVELDVARRYLKFLLGLKGFDGFKTHWHFEGESTDWG